MEIPEILSPPLSLAINQHYLLRISNGNLSIPIFTRVTLIGFTTCPAVVIVQDERNQRFPCGREELFCHQGKDGSHQGSAGKA